MDSALIDFLKKDYPAHFGQEWKEDTMQVRREQRPKGKSENHRKYSPISGLMSY